MRYQAALVGGLAVLLAGCNQLTVREALLSTNQRIVMVSTPGDGVSPPTNVVLLEERPGQFTPVATGFGTAPVPALLTGAVAGIAIGTGIGLGADSISQNCPGVANNSVSGSVGGGATGGVNTGAFGNASGTGGGASSSGSAALCSVN